MLEFLNNIFFWIIAFFTTVVLLIMMGIIFILIKIKTHAFVELCAFFKKTPVSIFMDDGHMLDMKATPVRTGLITDKEYGVFVRNKGNTYFSKQTRSLFDIYDNSFSPGINVSAAHAAQVLHDHITDEDDYLKIGDAIIDRSLEDEKIDCIRSNVNVSHLKDLYNNIEPHNINASIEKKIAQRIRAMNEQKTTQIILTFVAILGAIVAGYILLKIFNQ